MQNVDLRQQQHAILDNIPDMAWLKDIEGRYLALNPAYLQVLGMPEEKVLGRTPLEVWPVDIAKVYVRSDHAVLASGRRWRYEEIRRKPDGNTCCFETIKSPVRDVDGNVIGTVGISRDISERKAIENQLIASRTELRNLSSYQQKAREDERKRIARELHDELGQTLTAMKMDLGWLLEHLPARERKASMRIGRLLDLVDHSVIELQRIAADLRPLILDELGLFSALHWLAGDLSSHGGPAISVTFDRRDVVYDAEVATAAFRIVQEALTNVLRHSDAKSVNISACHKNDCLHMEIIDDGSGLPDIAGSDQRTQHGLVGMRERARMLGGSFRVTRTTTGHTSVYACLPLQWPGAVS